MSGRARDRAARSSTSSPPSVASSSTVSSRLVRKSQEVGGPVGIAGRKQSPGKLGWQTAPPQNDEQYLQARGYLDNSAITTSTLRQDQNRKSGGFLLSPAFNAKQRLPTEPSTQSHAGKGKGRADGALSASGQSIGGDSSHHSSNGPDTRSSDKRHSQFAQLRHSNSGAEQQSGRTNGTIGMGANGANVGGDLQGMRKIRSTDKTRHASQASPLRQPGMDPTEIVNMALNLSESRRRHLSAGRLASMPISSGRRVASAGLPQPNFPLQGSYRANESGNLLQQHLQKQVYSSRGVSPASARPDSYVSTGSNTSTPLDLSSDSPVAFDQPIGYGFHFSAGTIARAEKARKAIELSIEFRRLLQFLPPLQPDSSLPSNNMVTTTSHPGSATVEVSRVSSHADQERPLGRSYNPLQLIRNRKVRARERRQLDLDAGMWDDVEMAKCWIDTVEEQSRCPGYRMQDSVALPELDYEIHNKGPKEQQTGLSAKTKRTRLDWTFQPCEAFADAYWMERGDNKSSIEDRHGHKLFPDYKSPSVKDFSIDTQSAHDMRHKRKDYAEPMSASSSIASPDAREDTRGRTHKRRNFLHLPIHDTHGKFKRRSWHRSPSRSSTSTNLSSSEEEGSGGNKNPTIKISAKDEDTGPLARHMDTLMQSEKAEATGISPISPDHWDSQQARRPISNRFDNHIDSSTTGDSASPRDHRHWPTSKFFEFPKRPKRGVKEDTDRQPRSSLDTLDSTAPNSPNFKHSMPGISMDLSPPSTAVDGTANKHKKPKFSFLHHGDDKAKYNIESNDFAVSSQGKHASRLSADETRVQNRSSLEVPRPTRLRHVRSRTADESSSLRDAKDRIAEKELDEDREPPSAVERFFKSSRMRDLVRSEGSKLSDRIRRNNASNDGSKATEDSVGLADVSPYTSEEEGDMPQRESKPRPFPVYDETTETDDEKQVGRREPQYHMANLPSFKHSSALEKISTVGSTSAQVDDPISSQQRLHRERSRSQRFNRLAPPKIDLSNISRSSSPGLTRPEQNGGGPDGSRLHDRRSSLGSSQSRSRSPGASRDYPKGVRHTERLGSRKPPTGLSNVPITGPEASRSSSNSRSRIGSRHWSITDKAQEPHTVVNKREIARMEALFLSSGIKAKEITRRALTPRPETPQFLVKAAEVANEPLYPVARKEEHVLAARILSTHLERTSKDIEGSIQRFRERDVQNLRSELHEVRMRVADELTPLVLNKADEADAFTAELTSRHTLDIKQLNDYIELMKRQRWRRLRWVRRAGFTILEWMLLGFMWWVWLIVVVIKSVKTVVVGFVNGIRWILWL
ncbi:hypothetical protein EV356DRAFT_500534 [Viridothelium virens]|uniref:Uncharacterized protein n=1 Tax=Viridothelium virens TaxID=1048519 RepID=A0A6A6HAY0_VIRVR|nr:hypothetical protein EV356DRAFT_500534 [Viridothelium virens]